MSTTEVRAMQDGQRRLESKIDSIDARLTASLDEIKQLILDKSVLQTRELAGVAGDLHQVKRRCAINHPRSANSRASR